MSMRMTQTEIDTAVLVAQAYKGAQKEFAARLERFYDRDRSYYLEDHFTMRDGLFIGVNEDGDGVFQRYDDGGTVIPARYLLDPEGWEADEERTLETRLRRKQAHRDEQARATLEAERAEYLRLRAKFEDGDL